MRKVKKTENSMVWEECKVHPSQRSLKTTVPRKDYLEFIENGYEVESMSITFRKSQKKELAKPSQD